MKPINYGGRYTTNYIEDVKPPQRSTVTSDERSGLTNFRPFEELGRSLGSERKLPHQLQRRIDIQYQASSSAIGVAHIHSPVFPYTFVPPLGTIEFDWQANKDKIAGSVAGAMTQGRAYSVALIKEVVSWFRRVGRRVLIAATSAAAVLLGVFGLGYRYSAAAGVQNVDKTRAKSSAEILALALFAVVAGLLAWNLVSQPNGNTGTGGAHNSSHSISNSDSSSTNSTSKHTGNSGGNQTPASTTTAPSFGTTTGATDQSASPANALSGVSQTLPTNTTLAAPSTVTAPAPSGTTNPATLVPLTTTTVSPLTVQMGDKTLLSTSGTSLTTN